MYTGYYGTFFAHILSLIVSAWSAFSLQTCKIPSTCVKKLLLTSLISVAVNSSLCLLRYGLTEGYKLRKFHVVSLNMITIFNFTLISYALQLTAGFPVPLCYLPFLNIIPFYGNVAKFEYRSKIKPTDSIVVLNCLTFTCTAIYLENYYAVAFIASFIFGYVYVGDCGYFLDTEVPSIDIYQYVQCFLCSFTVNAFCEVAYLYVSKKNSLHTRHVFHLHYCVNPCLTIVFALMPAGNFPWLAGRVGQGLFRGVCSTLANQLEGGSAD